MPVRSDPLRTAPRQEVAPIYLEQNLDLIYRTWRNDRRGITIPTIWLALLLSLLIHLAAVWPWRPHVLRPSSEQAERESGSSSLSVQLAPGARPPGRPAAPAAASASAASEGRAAPASAAGTEGARAEQGRSERSVRCRAGCPESSCA